MNLTVEEMLTIGSIVRVRGSNNPFMIIGYCSVDLNEIFDYIGCLYPQGILDPAHNYVFDHEDVREVIYKGYSNDDDKKFKEEQIKLINDYKESIKEE